VNAQASRKKIGISSAHPHAIRGRAPCVYAVSLALALCAACNPNGQPSSQGGGGAGGMEPAPTLVSPGILRAVVQSELDMGSPLGTFASGGSAGAGGAAPGGVSGASSLGPPAVPPECVANYGTIAGVAPALVAPRAPSVGALPLPSRELGTGRHPLAAGCNSVGLSFIDGASAPAALSLAIFSDSGARGPVLGFGSVNTEDPAPGVAAFPDDTFVAAWTDFDADELGIQLQKLDPNAATQSPAVVANSNQDNAQFSPDLVFDGNELVVAWVDSSDPVNGPDLRYRTFARDLTPKSDDQTLAATSAAETDVALAALNGAWAAAWRSGLGGNETIEVQGGAVHWTVGPFLPGGSEDRPALVFLDATHLAVAFTEGTDPTSSGTANTPRLFAAVLDAAYPGVTLPFPVAPTVAPYASDPTLAQTQPALERVGNSLLVAWRSDAPLGDARGEELWSRSVGWSFDSSNTVLIDTSAPEQLLIADATLRSGDQRAPALISPPYGTQGNVISAWEDYAQSFGPSSGIPDVALQVSGATAAPAFTQISVSENYFTCARANDTTARCWGQNDSGQLGNDSSTNSAVPVPVSGLSNVTSVAAGGYSACALLDNGTVRCWGDNEFGQLGDGTTTSEVTPSVPVEGVTNAIAITSGELHSCALISDGTVKCWGYGAYGQLGTGSGGEGYPIATAAVTVHNLSGVTAIAGGSYHTCALIAGGAVECWGDGSQGQLGNGGTARGWEPVSVSGITGATGIGSGDSHSCAVLADQTAACWGDQSFGQLGDGVTSPTFHGAQSSLPVPVVGLSGVLEIAPAFTFTCARLLDHTVKCWGRNQEGEIGDGTTEDRLIPTPVLGLSGVISLAASDLTGCAILAPGQSYCWGYNGGGEIGDGTSTDAHAPSGVRFP
jgi:alpha-tubulin suppressor-like RCC1 family protein